MFIKSRSTRNKEKGTMQQRSIAMAIATATSAATASTRISVDKKGGGGRPCLDSKLVQHPRNHSIFTTFITTTTSAAAAAIATDATLDIAEVASTPTKPIPTLKVTAPTFIELVSTPIEPIPTPTEQAPTPTEPVPTPIKLVLTSTEPTPTPTEPSPTPTEPTLTPTTPTSTEVTSSKLVIPITEATEITEQTLTENQFENNPFVGIPEAEGGRQRPCDDLELLHDPFSHPVFTTTTTTAAATSANTVTTAPTTASEAPTATAPTATTAVATAPAIETHTNPTPTTKVTATPGPVDPDTPLGDDQLEKIPVDILQSLALFLTPQDFKSLSLTSKRIRVILDDHWVWHQRFVLHLGKGLLVSLLNPRNPDTNELVHVGEMDEGRVRDTTTVSKEKLEGWYRAY
ncbi:MAG: hypothetical protein J3R72DRAFT_152828 [Linnemannia gamsii]|nr:MAG: hypothetical protein J3R72DRAFT_152828 [Linnemannia gamsii]